MKAIDMVPDLRRIKVNAIAAMIFNAIAKHIPDEGRSRQHVMEDLLTVLYEAQADIITENDRLQAGLPPRGPLGWTHEELRIMEARRLELLMRPIRHMMPIGDEQGTASKER